MTIIKDLGGEGKMRILQMTNTYSPIVGGVERSIRSFVTQFKRQGHEIMIVAPSFEGVPVKEKGVLRLPAIQKFNQTDFSVNLPIPGLLQKFMRDFKPDIVHSHHPFLVGDLALRLSGQYSIPLVFTYHTMFEEYLHYLPFQNDVIKRFVIELSAGYANLADHVIVPSQSVYDVLRRRGVVAPIDIIPTGINIHKFEKGNRARIRKQMKIPEEACVVGHIGRLAPEKNLEFLAESIAEFLKKAKSAHALIGGQGPMEKRMQKIFYDNGVSSRVHFTGILRKQRLINAYHAMDIFVFTSLTETQGLVLTEAMAAGLPVVALDAPGARDIVQNGVNGRLIMCSEGNQFMRALCECANQRFHEFQIMKQACFNTAKRFSQEHCAQRVLDIYETVQSQQKMKNPQKHTIWSMVNHRIKREWEMAKNFAEAGEAALHSNHLSQHNYVEHWIMKGKRWFNRREWSSRLLGLSKSNGTQSHPGLVLIQIDGFSKTQMEKAINRGTMPFLKQLLEKEKYHLYPYYSGQPSSTPSVQGELFYGVKQVVPAFGFFDKKKNKISRMYDGDAAIDVEKRLARQDEGLLKDGSSYSNVYSGGADEVHFCSVSLGWNRIWKNINLFKMGLFVFSHMTTIVWTTILIILEFLLATMDCVIGLLKGYHWRKELKFILTRPTICILLRDLITLGATIDIERGLPVIHMNFLGYDEHAHRRGPSSRFAHKTLPGIDRVIARIYRQALNSSRRNYDIWIYSDHGQEDVVSYWKIHKKPVQQTVEEVYQEFEKKEKKGEVPFSSSIYSEGVEFQRIRYLGASFLHKLLFSVDREGPLRNRHIVVTFMGPTANVYLSRVLSSEEEDYFARQLVRQAKIPLVLAQKGKNQLKAWNEKGTFILPEQAEEVLGGHPYLRAVTQDLITVCHHPDAGAMTLSGWRTQDKPMSFPIENGAHAGPGTEETNAFAIFPSDVPLWVEGRVYLCTRDIRQAVLQFLGRGGHEKASSDKTVLAPVMGGKEDEGEDCPFKPKNTIRIMTYNVHSCLGMDGKISPERIARVIGRHEPDIVALQELDMTRKRTGGIDQPYIIAKQLEMMYHFHPAIRLEKEGYGDAIFSRYPIKCVKKGKLPGREINPYLEPRGAVWATIDVDENTRLQVFNTHLGLSRKERGVQTKALLGPEWLGHEDCDGTVIFCGDFNALPRSKVCREIKEHALRDVQEDLEFHRPKATWFGHMPLGRIDHIFVGSKIKVKKVEVSNTRLDKLASDHLPLIVDVEVLKDTKAP